MSAETRTISDRIHEAISRHQTETGNYPSEIWLGRFENKELEDYILTVPIIQMSAEEAAINGGRRTFAGCEVLQAGEPGIRVGRTTRP